MTVDSKDGGMISRPPQSVPTDPRELNVYLTQILRDHHRDIESLFAMCTDVDLFERKQRENSA